MNALILSLVALIVFAVAYKVYGRKLEARFGVEAGRKTPAVTNYDGIDYVPARHWTVLFGHHFSSIAGAGPIIGPIIAVSIWGWGPAFLWIVLGSIFIGGVHDFGSLMASVRHGGTSIADIAEHIISRRAKIIFSAFVWLALILVIAVFTYLCAKTLAADPRTVFPSIGLIPVAVLVGFLLYNLKWNQVFVTVLGLALLLALIFLGYNFPIVLGPKAEFIWGIILLAYCFIASVTPVQILLQPRDYLSAFLLVAGLVFGFSGIFLSHPKINVPFYIGWGTEQPLWPLLFVTVACGSISGFHSLIASGTTSKQLPDERYAKHIGYGGMLTEGVVAVMALICVAAGMGGLSNVKALLGAGGPGPVGAFGFGYGELTKSILGGFGGLLAIMVLNSFILTTLDTATRITRYLTQELFGVKNRFLATGIIVLIAGWLGLSGRWQDIWPVFGASNQLVAGLALIVITSWLLSRKNKVARFTFIPAILMLLITISALVVEIADFAKSGKPLLLIIALALLVLSGFMLAEAGKKLKKIRRLHA